MFSSKVIALLILSALLIGGFLYYKKLSNNKGGELVDKTQDPNFDPLVKSGGEPVEGNPIGMGTMSA